MERQEIIDAVGCGTEIAWEAANADVMPTVLADNGLTGDRRVVLYEVNDVEVIDTNGGAIWSTQYDGQEWAALVAEMIGGERNGMFYRLDAAGNAVILHETGEAVTRLDASVYPVGSDLSARYEHPTGVVLTVEDAARLGIRHEDAL